MLQRTWAALAGVSALPALVLCVAQWRSRRHPNA
jgi:hypothetical protein